MAAVGSSNESSPCSGFELGWWPYIAVSLFIYAVGLTSILFLAFAQRLFKKINKWSIFIHNRATSLYTSTDTLSGKAVFILTLIGNLCYYTLALYRTTLPMMSCLPTHVLLMESVLVCIISVNFILRSLSARRPLLQWFSLYNIIDVLTLFHPFVSLSLSYDWLGLRTLRFIWLIKSSKLLNILPWTNSSDIVSVGNIICCFTGTWLAASGLIQLLESTGDPWDNEDPPKSLTYWSSAYFVMVTVSTVGYGDVTAATVCGKVFLTAFIIVGLLVSAVALPTLLDVIMSYHHTLQYRQIYSPTQQTRLLLVCGYVTAETTNSFLKELLHPDKQDNTTHIIFLNPFSPTDELSQVLKRYFNRVQYFIGTPLSTNDLYKCGLYKSSSVIILANRQCSDPLDEDHGNLMRVVSIKTTCSTVPVILQLVSHQSKDMLASVPSWNDSVDRAICLNEIKMKMLAQTCLIKGFCTFVSNLFFATGPSQVKKGRGRSDRSPWQRLYVSGACKEVYSTKFSLFFVGMSVCKAAILCYEELNLTMLAVIGDTTDHFITSDSIGYFMADSIRDVISVQYYCKECYHYQRLRKPCRCNKNDSTLKSTSDNFNSAPIAIATGFPVPFRAPPPSGRSDPPALPPTCLIDHVVVCIFAAADSTSIGFFSFLSPLRSSTRIPIVVITDPDYFRREWSTISDHSHIYCIPGSPLDWRCLQRASIEGSRSCVILSTPLPRQECEYGIRDKEVIMCSLMLCKYLGDEAHIITDLTIDSHIHLLDTHPCSNQPAYLAEPFACGCAFISSVFDSLTTVVFHNPGIIDLLDSLLGTSEGRGSTCGTVVEIPMSSGSYGSFAGGFYGSLYRRMAERGYLCIGIRRELYPGSSQRCFATAPDCDVLVLQSDVVLSLKL